MKKKFLLDQFEQTRDLSKKATKQEKITNNLRKKNAQIKNSTC